MTAVTTHLHCTNDRRCRLSGVLFATVFVLGSTAVALASGNEPAASGSASKEPGVVNIYSYREPPLIAPLLKAFSAATGVKVNIVYSSAGLAERMAAEGRNSPADVLLSVDVGQLADAKAAGVTQVLNTPEISSSVPSKLRDLESHWVALTMRSRVVYASKDRVAQDTITYEELALPKWKGKICSRSGLHPYNTALIASIIANDGEQAAETWLRGVKANLAEKPSGSDRELARDVSAGKCDVALGNTYYMALMATNSQSPEQQAWARGVKLIFPNADTRGSHINISGVALAKYAPHRSEAVKLIEYLASPQAQKIYADTNNEYPVLSSIPASSIVQSFGKLKPDEGSLDAIIKYRKAAADLVDKVGFDAGPGT